MIALYRIFFIVILGLLFWSCDPTIEHPSINTIVVSPSDIQEVSLSTITSNVDFIALETTENNLISRIREIEHNEAYIFISDFYSLYQFSIDGDFIKKLGTNGEGPGEFMGIRSMAIDWEKKQIFLATIRKLICLDFNGKLVKEVRLSMLDGLTLIDGKLSILKTAIGLPSNEPGKRNNNTYRIEVLDNLELGDTTVVRNVKVIAGHGTTMPYGMSFISNVGEQEYIYFPVPYREVIVRDTLYQIVDNKLLPDIKIDFRVGNKITDRFEIINILRTSRYLITNYANKGTSESTLIHLPTSTVYSVKGGFQDDIFGSGEANLIPWDSKTDQFYFVKDAYELEGIIDGVSVDDNPFIFIAQLKN